LSGGVAGQAQAASDETYTIAVIGDVPYGAPLIVHFPAFISQINADPDVRMVTHLGDIKNGSTVCSDQYFDVIYQDFAQFRRPLVYTPGDNEWTDCHRVNNGAYNPLERLAKIRSDFFARPGKTLGQQSVAVKSQDGLGLPENVRYTRNDISFAAINIPGQQQFDASVDGPGLHITDAGAGAGGEQPDRCRHRADPRHVRAGKGGQKPFCRAADAG
jgi:hypothetical protein